MVVRDVSGKEDWVTVWPVRLGQSSSTVLMSFGLVTA